MDAFQESKVCSNKELGQLNRVRIYLQVATTSDIATADGKYISEWAFNANPIPKRKSEYSWIRQPVIVASQINLWTQALRRTLTFQPLSKTTTSNSCCLKVSLGHWTNIPNQRWRYYYNPQKCSLLIYRRNSRAAEYPFAYSSR